MSTSPAVALTAVEFEVCWQLLKLDELPPVLPLPSPGDTPEQRRQIETAVLAQLARRGLAASGAVGPWLESALRCLAFPAWAVDAAVVPQVGAPEMTTARAAGDGEEAVLAIPSATTVTLEVMPDYAVFPALASLAGAELRPRTAGARLPVSAWDQLCSAAAEGTLGAVTDELIDSQAARAEDVRSAAHALRGRQCQGEFRITRADGHGGLIRVGERVRWHRTASGLFLHSTDQGWFSMTPSSPDQLAARLRHLTETGR